MVSIDSTIKDIKKILNLKNTEFKRIKKIVPGDYNKSPHCNMNKDRIVCYYPGQNDYDYSTEGCIAHEGIHAFFEEYRRKNKIKTKELDIEEALARIFEIGYIKEYMEPCSFDIYKEKLTEGWRNHFLMSVYSYDCVPKEDYDFYNEIKDIKDPHILYNKLKNYKK